jgi:hypothetical protein
VSPYELFPPQLENEFYLLTRIRIVPLYPLLQSLALDFMHPALLEIMQRPIRNLPLAMTLFAKRNLTPLEKPELIRRIHRRMLQPPPEKVILARNISADMAAWILEPGFNLVQQIIRARLVGIDEKNPIVFGMRMF